MRAGSVVITRFGKDGKSQQEVVEKRLVSASTSTSTLLVIRVLQIMKLCVNRLERGKESTNPVGRRGVALKIRRLNRLFSSQNYIIKYKIYNLEVQFINMNLIYKKLYQYIINTDLINITY